MPLCYEDTQPVSLENGLARLFNMNEATWERHASGWSVWPRMAILPVLLASIWSFTWLGWWAALPLAGVLVFTWVNPRLAPIPKSTNTWHAKATFGERVWLNRNNILIPDKLENSATILSWIAGVGFLAAVAGAYLNNIWLVGLGMVITYAGKLLFLNVMVKLFEEMKDTDPKYASWVR